MCWYDPCEMESAARISTGSFKSSQPKSGYLRARNLIAQRLPLSYPQSLSELGGLSPGREWSGALGSVPEAAQAHHYALVPNGAHQIITFADLRVLSLDLGPRHTHPLASFLMVNPLSADS